ncbi:type II toxin-antitoxin system RelE/ParE family toxin [Microcoleus sp. FACHB-831]|nr:type II toxin-antitoxin system RelE/ParE family toxin [Microcoleus sp. FACHB-831]
MSNICRFTVPASRDIESIIDYVAGNISLDTAQRLLNKINQKCKTLANFPDIGRVDDYLIFCRPIEGGIEILRVVSGYRDLEALFQDEDEG